MLKRIFLEGPDGCGKTNISRSLSNLIRAPYFKVSTEFSNWAKGTFEDSIPFDILLPQFVEQTKAQFVSDRCYISEIVYSDVFGRRTKLDALWNLDSYWASLGAIVVMPLRREYSVVVDELVKPADMQRIHDSYLRYTKRTRCDVIQIFVDDFNNKTNEQVPLIYEQILKINNSKLPKKIVIEK